MDNEKYRAALSRFASGVTIVTTRQENGAPTGFTASSFTSLSLNPPMVLFCLARDAACFDAFTAAAVFAVNILGREQEEISNRFAKRGGEKFEGLSLRDGLGGLPLIEGCLANMECRTTETLAGGDHLIFLGEVLEVHLAEGRPLLYYQGRYGTV